MHLVEEFAGQQIPFGEQTKELMDTFIDKIMDELNEESESDKYTGG